MPSSGRTRATPSVMPSARGPHSSIIPPKARQQSARTPRPTKSHRTPSHQLAGRMGLHDAVALVKRPLPGDAVRGRTGHAQRTGAPAPATRPPRSRPQRVPQRRNRHSILRMWSPRRDRHAPQQIPSRLPLSPAKHNRSTVQQRAQTKKPPARQRPAGGPTSNRRYLTPRTSWRR